MRSLMSSVLLFLAIPIAMAQNSANTASFTDVTKPLLVAVGQKQLVIDLKANPTTGYTWLLLDYDHHLLALNSQQYLPPTDKKLMGASGRMEFRFDLQPSVDLASQMSKITFVYARPWEAISTQALTVVYWISAMQQTS